MRVVVTGGAGYIGSHVVYALRRAGHEPFVLDDLSNGHADAVEGVPLERGDVTAPGVLAALVHRTEAQAILHFAARIQVGESVLRPDLYYATNVGGMLRVAEAATQARIPVVLSSTAAVYGEPEQLPIPVTHPCRPENPYGWSKLMSERILGESARAAGFPFAVLRYFNAAGADIEARLRERHAPETHLVPLAIEAALGSGRVLKLFGTDWPTSDGTCLRDYVHVIDLADAHLRALDRLAAGERTITVNLGGGRGTTVRQVLDAVERAVGRPVPVELGPRRGGDVASLVADVSEAERLLGWKPTRSEIQSIVENAVSVMRS
jgi:UDP-glucose-4-epimerase GalE